MAHLTQMARDLPKAAQVGRPKTSWRDDLIAMAIGLWPIGALLFDGRNHNNQAGQESFFSATHIVLYFGLTAFSLWMTYVVVKHQYRAGADPLKGRFDFGAIPVGYGITVIGLIVLSLGGPADLIWHSVYGFEVNLDAVYSPPHLMLFTGGLLLGSTGFRAMWAKAGNAPSFKRFLPVTVSSILFLTMLSFVTMYLSAFMTNVTPTEGFVDDLARFQDQTADQSVGLNPGLTGYGDDRWPYYYYSGSHGMASMIISTVVILGPMLVLLRRWRPPAGALTLIFLGYGLMVSMMSEFRDWELIVPLVLAGAAIDLLVARLPHREDGRINLVGIRIVGTVAATVLWCTYYLTMALTVGLGWEPTLWVGALLIGTMTGLGVSLLVAPPVYGPTTAPEPDAEEARSSTVAA